MADAEMARAIKAAVEDLNLAEAAYKRAMAHYHKLLDAIASGNSNADGEQLLIERAKIDAKPESLTKRIMEIFTNASGAVSIKRIVAELGANPHSVRGTLHYLKTKGFIKNVDRGKWIFADKLKGESA